MHLSHPNAIRTTRMLLYSAAFAPILALFGCASPGPPRAPTLSLPQPVRDLNVTRIGDTVELNFTAPSRTTDKLPIRSATVIGQLCRQLEHQSCLSVATSKVSVTTVGPNGTHNLVTWVDTLPPSLIQGPPRLLAYRVEFFSPNGRSAGPSAPAFTIAGPTLAPVDNLHAQGSRLGIVLAWSPSVSPGDVLLRRENLAPTPPKPHKTQGSTNSATPRVLWLETHSPSDSAAPQNRTLDTTALPETPYRYNAQRRIALQLSGHSVELRSALSPPTPFTLLEIYPPPAPAGLNAAGFFASGSTGIPPAFAVDLIWQPIDETGLLAGLAGYNVYREPLNATGDTTAPRTRLNTAPLPTPAFHDTTANSATRYRYSVTAIDTKGNESRAVTVLLEPSAAQ